MKGHFGYQWRRIRRIMAVLGWRGASAYAMRGLPERFLPSVSWQYSGTLAGSAVSFLYAILVANALGTDDFGLMALGLGFAAFVSAFAHLRLRELVIRYTAKFQEENDAPRLIALTKFGLLLDAACGAVAFLLILALAPLARAYLLKDPRGWAVIVLSAAAYVLQNVADDTAIGLLRVFRKFKILALAEILSALIKLAGALAAVWWLNWGVLGVLAVLAVAHLATNFTLLGFGLWILGNRVPRGTLGPIRLLKPYAREFRRFLFHGYLAALTNFAQRDIDVLFLGLFTNKAVVGVYKLARSFALALYQLADAAFVVVYPELARYWVRKRWRPMRRFILRLSGLMLAGGGLAYAAAFLVVPPLVTRFMKPEFAEAGGLFRFMGFGLVLWAPLVWTGPLLVAANRTDLMLSRAVAGGVTNTLLFLIATWQWGAAGLSAAYALSLPIAAAYGLLFVFKANLLFPKEEPALAEE